MDATPPQDTAPRGALRHRLAGPCDQSPLSGLLARWVQADCVVETAPGPPSACPPGLAGDVRFPNWLRGALGDALMDGASAEARAGRPCPWRPPCALDVLWGETGTVRRGVPIPRPFVVRVDEPAPGGLRITLSLFGFATDWMEDAAAALVRALRHGVGMGPDGARLPLEPGRRVIRTPGPPPLPTVRAAGADEATLSVRILTPLILRRKSTPVLDPLALLTSLSRRAEGFARWHDTALMVDGEALARAAAALTLEADGLAPPTTWSRTSARQPGRRIPASGVVGRLTLRGPGAALTAVAPLLALGGRVGAGGHAAQGQGRFEVL